MTRTGDPGRLARRHVVAALALAATAACGPFDDLTACDRDGDCASPEVCGVGGFCRPPPPPPPSVEEDGGPPPSSLADAGLFCVWIAPGGRDVDGANVASWVRVCGDGGLPEEHEPPPDFSGRPADAGPEDGGFPAPDGGPLHDGRGVDAGPGGPWPAEPSGGSLDDGRGCSAPDGGLSPDSGFVCPEPAP